MRTDVKLGIVLGLGVLAVLAWYVVPSSTPQAIPLADSGGPGQPAAPTDKDGTALPPPLFNPPPDHKTSVSPPRADRRRAPGRAVAPIRPEREPIPTTTKTTTRRAAGRGAVRLEGMSTTPASPAGAAANRPISVNAVAPPAKDAVSKRRPPTANGKPKDRLPLVIPPGAEAPAKRKPKPEQDADVRSARLRDALKRPEKGPAADLRTSVIRAADRVKPIPMPKPPPFEGKPRPKSKTRIHVVQQYDSFAILAEKYYGSQGLAKKLWKANPHVPDARRLKLGTKLRIPPLNELGRPPRPIDKTVKAETGRERAKPSDARARSDKPAKAEPKETFYVVKADDSFYAIARKVWGDGNRWRELHKLNRDVCRDPRSLRPGMKLRLTPRAESKKTGKKGGTAKRATTKRSRPKSKLSKKPAD